jgi:hypothetical protein
MPIPWTFENGEGVVTPNDRAAHCARMLTEAEFAEDGQTSPTQVADMLEGLLYLCTQQGINAGDAFERARRWYKRERSALRA